MAVATAEPATPGAKHNIEGSRQAYYDKIAKFHMAPLWEVLKGLVTPEPKTKYKAAVWKFADIKRLILEAGSVISAEEAARQIVVAVQKNKRRAMIGADAHVFDLLVRTPPGVYQRLIGLATSRARR